MRFRVYRTSKGKYDGSRPHDSAFPAEFTYTSDRGEHTDLAWAIEIPDLDALLALVPEEYDIIITRDGDGFAIAFYDGYRE